MEILALICVILISTFTYCDSEIANDVGSESATVEMYRDLRINKTGAFTHKGARILLHVSGACSTFLGPQNYELKTKQTISICDFSMSFYKQSNAKSRFQTHFCQPNNPIIIRIESEQTFVLSLHRSM